MSDKKPESTFNKKSKSRFKEEKQTPEEIIDKFELIIGDAGGKIDNGDVPIRWCISKEYVENLEEQGIIDPHVLIASYAPRKKGEDKNFTKEMDRRMVPLTELMTYLRFTRAGKAKVYGIILDGSEGRKELHNRYMKVGWYGRPEIVYSYDDKLHKDMDLCVTTTSEIVEIPANVFGKEPSPWMKWYVNLWHEKNGRVVDECHYRRRLLLAFTLKWILVLIYTLCTIIAGAVITGLFSLCGWHKEVKFFRSFRPFKYPFLSINLLDGDIRWKTNFFAFRRKALHNKFEDTTPLLSGYIFTPILWIVIASIAWYFEPNGVVGLIMMTLMGILPIALLFVVIDTVGAVVELAMRFSWFKKFDNKLYEIVQWMRSNKYAKALRITILAVMGYLAFDILYALMGLIAIWLGVMVVTIVIFYVFAEAINRWLLNKYSITPEDNDYSNIKALLCPREEDNLRPNIKYIPKNRRTIRLWYLDMKNKVCKPMQR